MRQLIKKSLLALAMVVAACSAHAAELIMVEEEGCVYCERFNRQIAPAYPKTAEGKQAPLRRLLLSEPWPEQLHAVRPATVTPTFILINDGQEVDRLIGYPGDEHFWFLLNTMLEKLP